MENQKELEKRIEMLEKVVSILIVDRAAGINRHGEKIKPENLIEAAFPNAQDLNSKLEILGDFEDREILEKYGAIAELHKLRRALNINNQ